VHAQQGPPAPVEVLDVARTMPGVSAAVTGQLDVEAVLRRRDGFTSHHDDSSQVSWAEGIGIDVVRGSGRLSGERTVTVTDPDGTERTIRARHAVVLATGTVAAVPPVPGLADALPWTSRDVTNLHEVPRRVAIVGGGVVACESATWLRGLGAEAVTLVEPAPVLLARQEPFVSDLVARRFEQLGIAVLTSTRSIGSSGSHRWAGVRATSMEDPSSSTPATGAPRWTRSWSPPGGHRRRPTSASNPSVSTPPPTTGS